MRIHGGRIIERLGYLTWTERVKGVVTVLKRLNHRTELFAVWSREVGLRSVGCFPPFW